MRPPWLFALLATSACADPLPEPPDTAQLEAAYEGPTAAIDPSNPAALGPALDAVLELNAALGRGEELTGEVTAAVEEDPSDPTPLPYDIDGAGVAIITYVCPGWPGETVRNAQVSGFVEAAVRFDSGGFRGVFWGIADRCKVVVADARVFIDADLILIRKGIGALVSLTGTVDVSDEEIVDGEVDFLAGENGVDYRRELAGGGHILVRVELNGRALIRATNGNYRCDLTACVQELP